MKIFWLCLFYIFTIGGYLFFSNQATENHFSTALDGLIPVVPVFVVPYLFATVLFLALPIIFYIKLDWLKTKQYLLTQAFASFISYLIFFVFPTSAIREPVSGTDVFSQTLNWIYAQDGASAAFPSGHVFSSIIAAYFLWQYFPKAKTAIIILLPLIIFSTVFLKQHYTPDILGGIAVAIFSLFIINKFVSCSRS